MTASILVQEVI